LETFILLLPLGLVAGLLSGVLGIGGGLVFSPLLMAMGLSPHAALATSTVAIVPTTLGGTCAHLRNRTLPFKAGAAISAGAAVAGGLFSHLGVLLAGWHLLALQAVMYSLIAITFSPRAQGSGSAPGDPQNAELLGLAGVGLLAGLASGMLGIGGGVLMVPLMVRLLAVPVHQAVRYSTLAVLVASAAAAWALLQDGRALLPYSLLLGSAAAVGAQWSAKRLNRLPERRLVVLMRIFTAALAFDNGRRALLLVIAG
jgi:uncharacterized membrane protein YfcA